jgi:N-acetylglutamate synthase-like GNAT family acetyltransferase
MELRPYSPADRDACLAVFASTWASFPAPGAQREFESFLSNPAGPYYVMEHDGTVVGCGGFALPSEPSVAALVWLMVRGDMQRKGLGRYLLMYCLREIGNLGGIVTVHAEAPRASARFFESQGFRIAGAAGDRLELVKKLAVCA